MAKGIASPKATKTAQIIKTRAKKTITNKIGISKRDLRDRKTLKKVLPIEPIKKTKVLIKKKIKKTELSKKLDETSGWEGYSDDEGSVDSGVLDESVCFECGKQTKRTKEHDNLILCDICDSEYHLECVGLDHRPLTRSACYTCHRCVEDDRHFATLDFKVHPRFEVYISIYNTYNICTVLYIGIHYYCTNSALYCIVPPSYSYRR